MTLSASRELQTKNCSLEESPHEEKWLGPQMLSHRVGHLKKSMVFTHKMRRT